MTSTEPAAFACPDTRAPFPSVLDVVASLVVVLDADGRVVRLNRACERVLGVSSGEMLGRPLSRLIVGPGDEDDFMAMLAAAQTGRHASECETHWRTPDGERRVAWTCVGLGDAGGDQLVVTGLDVTERRGLQQSLLDLTDRERHRIGRDLHDGLGQHLTGIALMARVLERKLLGMALDDMAADAGRMVALVNEAIDRTREVASGGMLATGAGDRGLAAGLREVARDVERLLGIRCRLEADGAGDLRDQDAAAQLCHVAREAANNAVRHGAARQVVIDLVIDGSTGTLAIRDDGAGFSAEPTGSGLGLCIMRCRASAIGGVLEVERGGGRGPTTVTVRFPVRTVAAGATR
jgi:PAS domain S-box-containing protein